MRARFVRAVAAALGLVTSLTACGIQPTGIVSAGSKPVVSGRAAPITLYLLKGGRLVPVVRPGIPGHPYLAVEQLGVPLTSAERRQGLTTAVPTTEIHPRMGGRPNELIVDVGNKAVLSISELQKASRVWTRPALAQVACTAELIPGVRRVVMPGVPKYGPPRTSGVPLVDWRWPTCGEFADLRG